MSRHWSFTVLLIAAALSLGMYAWLARYAHPMGDDWSYAHMGRTHELLPWLSDQYFTWNGRYFSNILVGWGPLVWGLDHLWLYQLVPVALMLLTLVAAWSLVRSLTHGALTRWQQWSGGLLLTALFLHGMPDLPEGLYWYTGAITYQLGNVLLLLQLASFAEFLHKRYLIARIPHLILNLLLALAVVGCSEVHMLLLLAFHAAILLVHWREGERPGGAEWTAMAVVVIGAVVMFLAPGNTVRAAYFPEKHRLVHSLWMSFLQTGRFTLTWAGDLSLLLLSLLYLPVSRDLSLRIPLFQRSFHLTPLWSTLALTAVLFLCVFPAYWNTGILGQHRTLNVAYCFFLPLWFVNLTVWSNRFPRWSLAVPKVKGAVPMATALVAVHLVAGRNGSHALDDLFAGTAAHFDLQMTARYGELEAARTTQGPILLTSITAKPKALYLFDITDDPTFWTNRAYGIYFGLKGRDIVAAPPPDPQPSP